MVAIDALSVIPEHQVGNYQGLTPLAEALARSDATDPALAHERLFQSLLWRVLRRETSFAFHYQPIVDLRRGVVVGYEGLVRFSGDLRWSPDRWFEGAERYGVRLALEELVTRNLLQARGHLPRNCFLSVNTSPSFILSPLWDAVLDDIGTLGGIVVEITENEPVSDYQPLCAKLKHIQERGGCVAVDDAGSGYASLQHVMAIRPNFVKLDRVFITDCDSDRAKSALIEMVGQAAGRLDAWIIAEGVETETELDELIRLNVPLAQGYYLSRPTPEMTQLKQEQTDEIVSRVRVLTPADTVENATESSPVCTSEPAARELVTHHQHAHSAVVTDEYGRPLLLVERHPLAGVRILPDLMRAQAGTSDIEVLKRALTREAALRYDPLVAINEQGELVGIVRVDRLVKQVLERL